MTANQREPVREGLFYHEAYLKASNARMNSDFGNAVAVSQDGLTLVVGSNRESSGSRGVNADQSDTSAKDAGAIYVFSKRGFRWKQEAYIKVSFVFLRFCDVM